MTDAEAQKLVSAIVSDEATIQCVAGPPKIGKSTRLVAALAQEVESAVVCAQHTELAATLHVDWFAQGKRVQRQAASLHLVLG